MNWTEILNTPRSLFANTSGRCCNRRWCHKSDSVAFLWGAFMKDCICQVRLRLKGFFFQLMLVFFRESGWTWLVFPWHLMQVRDRRAARRGSVVHRKIRWTLEEVHSEITLSGRMTFLSSFLPHKQTWCVFVAWRWTDASDVSDTRGLRERHFARIDSFFAGDTELSCGHHATHGSKMHEMHKCCFYSQTIAFIYLIWIVFPWCVAPVLPKCNW